MLKLSLRLLALLCCLTFLASLDPKSQKSYHLAYDAQIMPEPYIPADNPLTQEGVRLGSLLFYDPLLSGNNKQSCGSCHQQQHAFTDGRKTAIGAKGDTIDRNTMSLLNLAWTDKFFWNGRASSLEAAILDPITSPYEMGQDTAELVQELNAHPYYPILFQKAFGNKTISFGLTAKALAQFVRTIVSNGITLPDTVLAIPPQGQHEQDFVYEHLHANNFKGMYFRLATQCGLCHVTNTYAGTQLALNGILPDKNQLFKIPHLVNISRTAPYMHDGRFKTAKEVILHYNEHIAQLDVRDKDGNKVKNMITQYDIDHIDEFFRLFDDNSVLTNPAFANPFAQPDFSWHRIVNY